MIESGQESNPWPGVQPSADIQLSAAWQILEGTKVAQRISVYQEHFSPVKASSPSCPRRSPEGQEGFWCFLASFFSQMLGQVAITQHGHPLNTLIRSFSDTYS